MTSQPALKRYQTQSGLTVYRLPVEAFPHHFTNCYLVLADEEVVLIDAASGWDQANQGMLAAFEQLRETYHETVSLSDVTTLLITHGHIDHYGGIHFVKRHAPQVKVGIHQLDAPIVEQLADRIIMSTKNLEVFLERAGLSAERVAQLSRMNKWSKDMFTPTPVDFRMDDRRAEPLLGLFRVYHTPGHCPGQVCLQLDDLLFSADHVLARITPHQSPEGITHHTGLGHYFDSLRTVRGIGGVRLTLGGHESEIEDLSGRVDEIRRFHEERLAKTLEICREPRTIADISRELFGRVSGYNVLLALLETGAHVEYLYQLGELRITNLDEVEREHNPVIYYQAKG